MTIPHHGAEPAPWGLARLPAGVEKERKGSSKGQDFNVFSGQRHGTRVRCDAGTEKQDFLLVIKSHPGGKCQQLFDKQSPAALAWGQQDQSLPWTIPPASAGKGGPLKRARTEKKPQVI